MRHSFIMKLPTKLPMENLKQKPESHWPKKPEDKVQIMAVAGIQG